MNNKGKAGCGCLIFILVACMIITGILIHPFSLKTIGSQLRYEDKVFPSDAIFVPRFFEDKNGELYTEAFREYWAGNGKTIWIEDDKILGISLLDIVAKTAHTRGIKEGVLKKLEIEGEGSVKVKKIQEAFSKIGAKKVIILVPEYASRRFHLFYGLSKDSAQVVYLIKPVNMSYFKKDKWWKEPMSRDMFLKELSYMISYCLERFKYGEKKDIEKP
ncbi:MAG: hypothetical protein NT178_04265 [Proteobacteria bacterium]|nr:hypothetical protein [Pseudomonadota bacterium]